MNSKAENIKSLLDTASLLKAVNGKLFTANEVCFTSVSIDSRNVKKNSLFVPLIGENQNGHDYIPSALKNGASVVFVAAKDFDSRKDFYSKLQAEYSDTSFVIVNNTLAALQDAAAEYVSLFPNLIKIGVTGSSGKTTTKEILVSILSQRFNVISNVGNFNSETGLPLSVFNIRSEHEVGVFEMGMNRVNEIGELANVLKPKYGIITNIGTAHIGILGSRQGIACEKKKIFSRFTGKSCVGFVPADDDFCDYLMADVNGSVKKYSKETCGVSNVEDAGLEGTRFLLGSESVILKLPGKYNLKNTLAAILLSKE
ncbi:MAG: UDP-N-acetylmuramoylalanyl-D-glutamate--2,6-diaminopimelate ligase, partial [Treponema sp.]|nr:UDP-N-acetylmuramoylalanyl-D-glutamate--2,6-diaminopimelate ligase [Treponema sp.]